MTAREFPSAPRIGVGAVVLDEEGRVLLVKRANDPGKGRWSLPGGLLELGEMIETAVAREVAEETGIAVAVMAKIDLVERIYFEDGSAKLEGTSSPGAGPRVRYHYVILDYLCRASSGDLRASSDAEAVMWAAREDWEFHGRNPFNLDLDTRRMIEKGWQMWPAERKTDGHVS